jgi:hypothetical protein
MIREAAFEVIKRLAQRGIQGADLELLAIADNADGNVRLAAVVAHRSLPDLDDARGRDLKAVLNPRDRWILDVEIAGAPPASAHAEDSDASEGLPSEPQAQDEPAEQWNDSPGREVNANRTRIGPCER